MCWAFKDGQDVEEKREEREERHQSRSGPVVSHSGSVVGECVCVKGGKNITQQSPGPALRQELRPPRVLHPS